MRCSACSLAASIGAGDARDILAFRGRDRRARVGYRSSPQALQKARQTGITTGGWAPVHMYNWDTMRSQMSGKELQAQIHDTRASHKQLWQASWPRDDRILLLGECSSAGRCALHGRPLGRAVLSVYAKHSGGETDRLRVAVSQE